MRPERPEVRGLDWLHSFLTFGGAGATAAFGGPLADALAAPSGGLAAATMVANVTLAGNLGTPGAGFSNDGGTAGRG